MYTFPDMFVIFVVLYTYIYGFLGMKHGVIVQSVARSVLGRMVLSAP